jgi:hypothetical protein
MLFLYRPRQTWMPHALPRSRSEQAAYNRQLQRKFAGTRRVPPARPAAPLAAPPERRPDTIADLQRLGELRTSGVLTDAEFEAQKAKLLSR